MTSQLAHFRCLFLSCQQQKKTTENGAAMTLFRSFLFRDDFIPGIVLSETVLSGDPLYLLFVMCPRGLCSDLLPTCSCPRSNWMPPYVKCTCTYIGCTLCISTQYLCKLRDTYNGIQVCIKSYLIFYKLKFQQDFCLTFLNLKISINSWEILIL